jgi:site-specific DNA-cytosine methylase
LSSIFAKIADVSFGFRSSSLQSAHSPCSTHSYQVRPDVYNAASFGAPQVRRRLILTASRRGIPLPASPKTTHAYLTALTGMAKRTYDGGARTHIVTDCHRPHGHGPDPAVTFAEAASDLPSFGFADPFGNVASPIPSQQQWESGQPIGFGEKEKRPYAQPLPQTAHQRAAR